MKKPKTHWTEGGSGITNFPNSQLKLYQEAIEGYPDLFVVESPIDGDNYTKPKDHCSLHSKADVTPGSLSEFWRHFDKLRKKYNDT